MKLRKGHLYVLFWIVGGLFLMWWGPSQPIIIIAFASCVVVAVLVARVIRLFGLVSAPAVYIIIYSFFHFGTVFSVFVFRLPVPQIRTAFLESADLGTAVTLATVGLLAFTAGAELYSVGRATAGTATSRFRTPVGVDRDIFNVAVLLVMVVAVAFIAVGLKSGVLIHGKTAIVAARLAGERTFRLFGLFSELLSITSFIAVAYAPRRYILWMASIPLVLGLPLFLSGQRGYFIVTVAALGIIVKKKGIRIPNWLAIASIPSVMFIISLMRQITKVGAGSFGSTWFLNALYEMGVQINIVSLTIQAIRTHVTGYWLGASYLSGLGRVIPNVGGIRDFLPQNSPAIWITQQYGTWWSGMGFSSAAEPYLNFGWLGVFVILGAVGFFLSRFERVGAHSNRTLAVYGAALGGLFFAIRGDMGVVFRWAIWAMVLVWILRQIVMVIGSRSHERGPRSAPRSILRKHQFPPEQR